MLRGEDRTVSVLCLANLYPCFTKKGGAIGKSIPNAREIFRDLESQGCMQNAGLNAYWVGFNPMGCMEAAMFENVWCQQCSSKTYTDGWSGMCTENGGVGINASGGVWRPKCLLVGVYWGWNMSGGERRLKCFKWDIPSLYYCLEDGFP